jgi:type VI protein secretion system component Hcp
MELTEPKQSLFFEGLADTHGSTYFVEPMEIYRWVGYVTQDMPLSISGDTLLGIKTLLFGKPIGLESPLLFKMCNEGTKIPQVQFVMDFESEKLTLNLTQARISKATIKGISMIAKYGSESIYLNFETVSLLVETKTDGGHYKKHADPCQFFQDYADIRDIEEEREIRERMLSNYRKDGDPEGN